MRSRTSWIRSKLMTMDRSLIPGALVVLVISALFAAVVMTVQAPAPPRPRTGTVLGKHYSHPSGSWYLQVRNNGSAIWNVKVSEETYDRVKAGDFYDGKP